ncbi:MAG: YdeI/OmpD-associated family protein [Saprospiraceae bacterium]|nr:YdeI/OmpD-associated family protein [Saprospiraceae bacterium]
MPDFNNSIRPPSRQEWRKWLSRNHHKEENVWCIVAKKDSKVPGVNYVDAVEEAICFGWIDSKALSCDEDGYYQYFARRKPGSPWTRLNKSRVEALIQKGLMSEAGYASIEAAKASGGWYLFDDAEDGILPDDLKLVFQNNPVYAEKYQQLSPAKQKQLLMALALKKGEAARRKVVEAIIVG